MPYTREQMVALLRECKRDPLMSYNIDYWDRKDKNPWKWKVVYVGPKNTPYEGGIFTIVAYFPEDYPKYGAEFRFRNKIYHLNVCQDDLNILGRIDLSKLNEWRHTGKVWGYSHYTVKQALFDIFCSFDINIQNPLCAYDRNMEELYLNFY